MFYLIPWQACFVDLMRASIGHLAGFAWTCRQCIVGRRVSSKSPRRCGRR